jgi:hypothetical protein
LVDGLKNRSVAGSMNPETGGQIRSAPAALRIEAMAGRTIGPKKRGSLFDRYWISGERVTLLLAA